MPTLPPFDSASIADDAILILAEAAEYLGLSQSALRAALERGEIRAEPGPGPTHFIVRELDRFLDNQRAKAAITGKLTMPLAMVTDVPALLREMVTLPDERSAAVALANEITTLAGACCRATVILRVDDAAQRVRLLALSELPDDHLCPIPRPIEANLSDIPAALRVAIDGQLDQAETTEPGALLQLVMGAEAKTLIQKLDVRAAMLYPLLCISDTRWVMLLLLDRSPADLSQDRRDAVAALGVQASVALEAVRLRDDVLHRARRAEALYGTARMLARSEDFNSLLERLAVQASRLLAGDAGAILIYDADQETFRPGASTGLDPRSAAYRAGLSSAYLVGRAARMSGPLQITDVSQTSMLSLPELTGMRKTMAAICAPIIHRGTMLGAIEIYSAVPRTFSDDDTDLLNAFAHQAAVALNTVQTIEVRRRALLGAVEALASANEARDGYTGEHCKRLAQLAVLIARSRGFSEEEVERIGLGAALHDIGKIAVPDAILRKPGPLTDDERAIIQLHPATGQEIVGRVPELQDVALMIGAHQERWDGKGYPHGLAGSAIPVGARIIAVVDTYAALIEDRPYRAGATHADALAEILAGSGTQFDPEIVSTFTEVEDSIRQLMDESAGLAANHALAGDGLSQAQLTPGTSYLPARSWQIHRAGELGALNDIVRMIATTRDLTEMYEHLYRKLGELIDIDAMLILLPGEQPPGTRQLPDLSHAPQFPPIGKPAEAGIITSVASGRRSVWIDDYHTLAREQGFVVDGEGLTTTPRSVIATPMLVDDQLLGVLTIQALHPNAYSKRHVELLEDIALHVAVVLRNHRDQKNAERQSRWGISAHGIDAEFDTLSTTDAVAQALAARVTTVVSADGCVIYLLVGDALSAAVVEGYYSPAERQAMQTYRIPRDVGVIWAAIDEARPAIVPNLAEDNRGAVLLKPPVPGESALIVPLVAGGISYGVVVLSRLTTSFDAHDAQRLHSVGIAAARALAGLRLGNQQQQHLRDLAGLQVALAKVGQATTPASVLDALVTSLHDNLDYRLVSLYLRDADQLVLRTQTGYDAIHGRLPLDRGVLARSVRSGKSVLVADVSADAEFIRAMSSVRSEIAVPLTVHGRVIGCVNVESGRERPLSAWDQSLIETLAQQAQALISNLQPRRSTATLVSKQALVSGLELDIRQARAAGRPVSLLAISPDHLGLTVGAGTGSFSEELLGWLEQFLPRGLPANARIARHGGDSFVAILPGATVDAACTLAEALRNAVSRQAFESSRGHSVIVSISVGVAGTDPSGADLPDAAALLHAARSAMDAARRDERKRVIRWTASLDAQPHRRTGAAAAG